MMDTTTNRTRYSESVLNQLDRMNLILHTNGITAFLDEENRLCYRKGNRVREVWIFGEMPQNTMVVWLNAMNTALEQKAFLEM